MSALPTSGVAEGIEREGFFCKYFSHNTLCLVILYPVVPLGKALKIRPVSKSIINLNWNAPHGSGDTSHRLGRETE